MVSKGIPGAGQNGRLAGLGITRDQGRQADIGRSACSPLLKDSTKEELFLTERSVGL